MTLSEKQLKSYAVGSQEKERYYSLYFDEQTFIVIGNSVHGTTNALVICEYFASVGSLIVIYIALLLSKSTLFSRVGKFLSDISIPCFAVKLTILIKDILSYHKSFHYTSEWLRSFPIPIVFPVCAIINLVLSVLVVKVISEHFPLPGLLNFCYIYCCNKNKYIKVILQSFLIFSITSVAVLVAFHFAWVLLAFSAYPVRSIASQAFIVPFLSLILTAFFIIDSIASTPALLRQMKSKATFSLVIASLTIPFIIAIFGVLYYYSQVLVEVNDSENSPIKTVIGGATPTVVAAIFAWTGRKIIKAYVEVNQKSPQNDNKSRDNVAKKGDNEVEIENNDVKKEDSDMFELKVVKEGIQTGKHQNDIKEESNSNDDDDDEMLLLKETP